MSGLTRHALEEYPTAKRPADYALFVNGLLLGILEAKDTEKFLARTAKSAPQVTKPAKPIPLSELDKLTVMAVIRKVSRDRTAMSRDDLLKDVSMQLGYRRLSARLTVYLKGEMRAAMLRGIIRSEGDRIIAASTSIDDYDTESLIRFISAVMAKGKLFDEETMIRETAMYLGFQRLTAGMKETMKSVIRNAIRQGIIQREGRKVFRP